ncbi:MAG: M16 family metallopeptidase [Propionibacteriaceae bacterium]
MSKRTAGTTSRYADPTRAPELGPPGSWSFPTPRHARLDNGIDVVVHQLPGQYVITAHLIVDTPLNAEPRALEGVATICARALDEGSVAHPGAEFAELLETEGASFGVDVSLAGFQTILDVPVTRLEPALHLFAEAMTRPAFARGDVDRHVQLRLAQIEQARANSAQTAAIAFRNAVFAPEGRAARMTGGEAETVAEVDAAAVRTFYDQAIGPRGTTLVLAGDFPTDPVPAAAAALGRWTNDAQQTVAYVPPAAAGRRARIIDRPGSVQSDLRLGGFGIDRADPRWADLTVASYAMGGAFLSRLNAVLREERGYTYGVQLQSTPQRSGGSFAVQGSFRSEVTVAALQEALQLLRVDGCPFTEVEVQQAQTYFAGVSPLRYATADGVADQAATQRLLRLPEDYVDANLAALDAVTPESATAAYRSLVDVDALTLVLVGDASVLAEPVRALGFGDLEVVGRRPGPEQD